MKRKHLKSLTLLEMLISIGIIALVMGAVAVALQQSLFVFKANAIKAGLSRQAASAADWLVRDIRDSCCVFQPNNTSLILQTASEGYVKYRFENSTLSRTLLKDCASAAYSPVSMDIAANALEFSYYNTSNKLISDMANSTGNVKAMGIKLTTEKEGRTFNLNTLGAFGFPANRSNWARYYANSSQNGALRSLINTKDGGYIIVGYARNLTGALYDLMVIKTDPAGNLGPAYPGNISWAKSYGGLFSELGADILQLTDGSYIIGAFSNSSFNSSNPAPYYRGLILNINSTGNLSWAKTYGGKDGQFYLISIQKSIPDGGYITGGYTSIAEGNPIYGGNNFILMKTDSVGNIIWRSAYGGRYGVTGSSAVEYLVQASDGGYLAVGDAYDFYAGGGGRDALWIKTDVSGNMLWSRLYGGSAEDTIQSVDNTDDGGYIMCGATACAGKGGRDWLLVRTNPEGNITGVNCTSTSCWVRTFGGTNSDTCYIVHQTPDGGYITAGYTDSFGAVLGDRDVMVIKTNSTGNVTWARTYNTNSTDSLWEIRQTPDGGYLLGGEGNSDVYPLAIKIDANGDISGCSMARNVTAAVSANMTVPSTLYFNATPGTVSQTAFGEFVALPQTSNITVGNYTMDVTNTLCPPSCP